MKLSQIRGAAALALLLLATTGLVSGAEPAGREATQPPPPLAGADRDEHGCIGSAGYTWCEREAACVRSWELAAQKGFKNSAEAFQEYCRPSPAKP